MATTSASLLERMRDPDDDAAWSRFVHLYTPLLFFWARKIGLRQHDAEDLVQEVFLIVRKMIPSFVYDQSKSFRGWLRKIAMNKWKDMAAHRRNDPLLRAEPLAHAAIVTDAAAEAIWDAEYQQQLVSQALKLIQNDFQPTTWQAFWEQAISGRPAAPVAKQLKITLGAAYACKARVLDRLRQELNGLED